MHSTDPNRLVLKSVLLTLMASSLVISPYAQSLERFEEKVTRFTLKNGLTFIVLERHEAPVVSFHTYADVGAVDEVKGITGMAHLFEHLAFKGSRNVGTKDYKAEEEAMTKMDALFLDIKKERRKEEQTDGKRLQELQKRLEEAQQEAASHLVPDEFEEALSRAGSTGLNASTSWDATRYTVSLPSNKVELWMSLESDRFLNPVLREFYKERNVVMEERRLRTENQPVGRLIEEFLGVAFKAHPYGEPVVGHMSDLETLTRAEAETFFRKYYSPSNLTLAIVGDVDASEVRKLAETYFGRIPGRPKPDPVETVEPLQLGERRVVVEDSAQPFVLVGYHKPNIKNRDNPVFDTITDLLGLGRTSRLYKSLVKESKVAVSASAFQSLPGNKYPGLFLFFVVPTRGHTGGECEGAIYTEIQKLKSDLVSVQELEKAKTRSRASLIRSLSSNRGLAAQLAFYEAVTGDWRNLFKQLEEIERVTAEDIQRVARKYFTRKNRTIGIIQTQEAGG